MMRNRAALLILLACIPALAGGEPKPPPAPRPVQREKVLTGKERLGPKWSDEQRVDNCKVPPEKRGKTPRPDKCTRDIPGS